jgi:hypothetical protein
MRASINRPAQTWSRVVITLFLVVLPSCGYLKRQVGTSSAHPARKEQPARASRVPLEQKLPGALYSDVEVLWEIPREPVEGFIITYGVDQGSSIGRVKVRSDELTRYEDQRYGFVYHYVLKDVPADKAVRVSISAYKGAEVSEQSRVIVVPAETRS